MEHPRCPPIEMWKDNDQYWAMDDPCQPPFAAFFYTGRPKLGRKTTDSRKPGCWTNPKGVDFRIESKGNVYGVTDWQKSLVSRAVLEKITEKLKSSQEGK